jgi:predicted  nucleic acid-binding Zn-ribbon protein
MSALDMLEKLHADLIRQRREVEADLKRLADAYHAKLIEYHKLSHGIIGIENEIEKLKERS